jgi:predicted  nucleic acid-binding Zn-ribbon protein
MTFFDKLKTANGLKEEALDNAAAEGEEGGEENGGRPRSATGSFGMHKLTDMQSALLHLSPDLGEDLNHIFASRIFPDIYRPFQRMLVKDILFRTRGDYSVSVVSLIAKTNTVLSSAIDGEHIIDVETLMSGARREEAAKESMLGALK